MLLKVSANVQGFLVVVGGLIQTLLSKVSNFIIICLRLNKSYKHCKLNLISDNTNEGRIWDGTEEGKLF